VNSFGAGRGSEMDRISSLDTCHMLCQYCILDLEANGYTNVVKFVSVPCSALVDDS
jgi:hypothetical protein